MRFARVFAIDVSRMARSSEDWRRLLVLCGVAGVAVVDEQRRGPVVAPRHQRSATDTAP
jgi:hypothetical protein